MRDYIGSKPTESRSWLSWIALAIIGTVVVIALYYSSSNKPASTATNPADFNARFDSLYRYSLRRIVWKSGTFTYSKFEGDYEKWMLTISSKDWKMRDEGNKRDLAATLWAAYRGTRAQAGGNPDDATLVIQNEKGEVLVECTPGGGIRVLR